MNHEESLINAFVRSAKRARFIEFVGSPKRRPEFLVNLYHFGDLDTRYLVPIPPAERQAKNIAALLTARGAPSLCHVISTNSQLDGRDLNLVEVLEQIVGFGEGTLISCIPGRLGYFEGESPNDRFILERAAQQAFAAVGGRCDHEPPRLKRGRWADKRPNDNREKTDDEQDGKIATWLACWAGDCLKPYVKLRRSCGATPRRTTRPIVLRYSCVQSVATLVVAP